MTPPSRGNAVQDEIHAAKNEAAVLVLQVARDAAKAVIEAARAAAEAHTKEVHMMLGYRLDNFAEMQRLRDDLEFAHKLRANAALAGKTFALSIITLLAGAVLVGMWAGIKTLVLGR